MPLPSIKRYSLRCCNFILLFFHLTHCILIFWEWNRWVGLNGLLISIIKKRYRYISIVYLWQFDARDFLSLASISRMPWNCSSTSSLLIAKVLRYLFVWLFGGLCTGIAHWGLSLSRSFSVCLSFIGWEIIRQFALTIRNEHWHFCAIDR